MIADDKLSQQRHVKLIKCMICFFMQITTNSTLTLLAPERPKVIMLASDEHNHDFSVFNFIKYVCANVV